MLQNLPRIEKDPSLFKYAFMGSVPTALFVQTAEAGTVRVQLDAFPKQELDKRIENPVWFVLRGQ